MNKNHLWLEWIRPILIAMVLAGFIRTFFFQPFKERSRNLEPTVMQGERVFVNKFIYGARIPYTPFRLPAIRQPRYGDIVVFLDANHKYCMESYNDNMTNIVGKLTYVYYPLNRMRTVK